MDILVPCFLGTYFVFLPFLIFNDFAHYVFFVETKLKNNLTEKMALEDDVLARLTNNQYSYIFLLLLPFVYFIWRKITSLSSRKQIVGYVKEIRTHPVKSCKPYHVKEIEVNSLGLKFDRYNIS